jgi:predicted AAA+ superfamily ATPase
MIARQVYLADLERHRDKSSLIKVITGIRHSRKSTLMHQFQKKKKKKKVPSSCIINISLEGIENEELRDGKLLYKFIKNKIKPGVQHYVFIDEIQLASEHEEAANSLRL